MQSPRQARLVCVVNTDYLGVVGNSNYKGTEGAFRVLSLLTRVQLHARIHFAKMQ